MDYSLNEGHKSMMHSVSKNITGNFDLDPTSLYSSGRGEIFHITNKQSKQSFCLKVIWNSNNETLYKHEKSIHCALKNRYIVKLQNAFADKINFYLVLEYCKNGNLRTLLQHPLPLDQVRHYGLQIAKAIDYLHNKKRVIHHEIKPENILLTDNSEIRLCDFGAAVLFQQGKNVKGCELSLNYSPPEAIEMHNQKYDIWSFGCVLYEMAVGRAPFSFRNLKEKISAMNQIYISKLSYEGLPPALAHLLGKIFVLDVSDRIPIDAVMAHPFFTGQPLQLSQRIEAPRAGSEKSQKERGGVNRKKCSSKSSFKSVELKQSKRSNKQNRELANRLNGAKKVYPPNYREMIEKKFKTPELDHAVERTAETQEKLAGKTLKQQFNKTEELKKVGQNCLSYEGKLSQEGTLSCHVQASSQQNSKLRGQQNNKLKGQQQNKGRGQQQNKSRGQSRQCCSPLQTRHMRIAPLKINNYEIRIDKQGFTRESVKTSVPQQIVISCDGKLIKMRKGKKEKIYSFDALPAQYWKEYQQCKKLLTEIQADEVRLTYTNRGFEQDKGLQLNIMYDGRLHIKLDDQFEFKGLTPEELMANSKHISERYHSKLKDIYRFLAQSS